MKWQRKKLGNLIQLNYGKSLPERSRINGEIPVYGSGGIGGYHNEPLVKGAGIIVGRKGTVGSVYYEKRDFFPIDTVYYVSKLDEETDLKFIYYLLKTLSLEKLNTHAAVPGLNRDNALALDVYIPDSKTQTKIASILSAYDDLIENNTRRIAILEEMARRIYEEWFVRFRFPGHEQVKMVESELGLIPEGWEIKRLEDVLSALESGSRPKGGIDANEREVPSIGAENINGLGNYDYSKDKFISREFFENMNRGVVKSGDVLLYKDGAYIGRKAMFQNDYPHKECAINEHVFILRSGEIPPNYLYFWLDTKEMTAKIKGLNSNAAQPGINQAGVKSLPIMVPNKDVLFDFDERIQPLISLLFNLAKKKALLRKTRDLLLPKLISGEVDVSHFPEPENV
jgi:Restriction endonuclease S subunits